MTARITDANALTQGLVWVLLTYPDGSEFCFQTTLNTSILRDRGVILEEGKLVRLDKKYLIDGQMLYKQFSYQGATISLWRRETYTDSKSAELRQFI